MTAPLIRLAYRADIPHLVRFNRAMALETEDISLDERTLTKGVEAIFDEPHRGFYIVCELGKEVVASLMITYEWSDWRNGNFWWIQSVYVDKQNRRLGLYRLMYEYIKKLLIKDKTTAGIRLYVDEHNHIAQEVYSNLGMKKSNYQMFEYIKQISSR